MADKKIKKDAGVAAGPRIVVNIKKATEDAACLSCAKKPEEVREGKVFCPTSGLSCPPEELGCWRCSAYERKKDKTLIHAGQGESLRLLRMIEAHLCQLAMLAVAPLGKQTVTDYMRVRDAILSTSQKPLSLTPRYPGETLSENSGVPL